MSEPHACPFRLGGTGDVKPADEHIQGLVDQVKFMLRIDHLISN